MLRPNCFIIPEKPHKSREEDNLSIIIIIIIIILSMTVDSHL